MEVEIRIISMSALIRRRFYPSPGQMYDRSIKGDDERRNLEFIL
jgi:hypothetical protein